MCKSTRANAPEVLPAVPSQPRLAGRLPYPPSPREASRRADELSAMWFAFVSFVCAWGIAQKTSKGREMSTIAGWTKAMSTMNGLMNHVLWNTFILYPRTKLYYTFVKYVLNDRILYYTCLPNNSLIASFCKVEYTTCPRVLDRRWCVDLTMLSHSTSYSTSTSSPSPPSPSGRGTDTSCRKSLPIAAAANHRNTRIHFQKVKRANNFERSMRDLNESCIKSNGATPLQHAWQSLCETLVVDQSA